ncbi:MAG TPA: pirin family protein [Chitinophagales bacterium]|nr:pirin family protein [Chitinophagales bacterium]
MKKQIEEVMTPPAPHMVGDGFRVHNFFPGTLDIKRMSPFFLMDYNAKVELAPTEKLRGVGVHPHRGFETVTIAYHGKVAHHDSAGNSGVIGEGDVQWMTAASGILHKEYHEQEFSRKGGAFQMVQLWVNLPAKDKMSKPKYQALSVNDMGKYQLPDNGGHVDVIAGEFKGVKGPAFTFSPIQAYNLYLNKGAKISFDLPENYNTGLLVVEGDVVINEQSVPVDNFVLFENKGTQIEVEALADAKVLVLSGEPINEPIFAYGPFLMNTREEVIQAYDDVNAGKFGYLED